MTVNSAGADAGADLEGPASSEPARFDSDTPWLYESDTMSRIGNQPVSVPSGVKVHVQDDQITVESSKGKLFFTKRPEIGVEVNEDEKTVAVSRKNDLRPTRALHGTTRAQIANMIQGVTDGFTRELEIVGVGWNAQVKGQTVALNVGFADTKQVPIPDGVTVQVQGPKITISGMSKQLVGQCAADIRGRRPPEPYNGKGIKYSDETVIRKAGKAFGSGG